VKFKAILDSVKVGKTVDIKLKVDPDSGEFKNIDFKELADLAQCIVHVEIESPQKKLPLTGEGIEIQRLGG
jgi:hypothetical protein